MVYESRCLLVQLCWNTPVGQLLMRKPFCREVLIGRCALTSSSQEIKTRRIHSKAQGAVIKLGGYKSAKRVPEKSSWYERNGTLWNIIYYFSICHRLRNKLRSAERSGNAAALCNTGLWYLKPFHLLLGTYPGCQAGNIAACPRDKGLERLILLELQQISKVRCSSTHVTCL